MFYIHRRRRSFLQVLSPHMDLQRVNNAVERLDSAFTAPAAVPSPRTKRTQHSTPALEALLYRPVSTRTEVVTDKSYAPSSIEALLRRLSTFKPSAKAFLPARSSPPFWARHGWTYQSSPHCLSCVTCTATWIKPSPTTPASPESTLPTHAARCPWLLRPSPQALYSKPPSFGSHAATITYLSALKALPSLESRSYIVEHPLTRDQLPHLRNVISSALSLNLTKEPSLPRSDVDVGDSNLAVALLGWTPDAEQKPSTPIEDQVLECRTCFARIGLWTIASETRNTNNFPSSRRVLKQSFNVVTAHRDFCPIAFASNFGNESRGTLTQIDDEEQVVYEARWKWTLSLILRSWNPTDIQGDSSVVDGMEVEEGQGKRVRVNDSQDRREVISRVRRALSGYK